MKNIRTAILYAAIVSLVVTTILYFALSMSLLSAAFTFIGIVNITFVLIVIVFKSVKERARESIRSINEEEARAEKRVIIIYIDREKAFFLLISLAVLTVFAFRTLQHPH